MLIRPFFNILRTYDYRDRFDDLKVIIPTGK